MMERKRITELVTDNVVNKYIKTGDFGKDASCQAMTYPEGTVLVISTKVNQVKYSMFGDVLQSVRVALIGDGMKAEMDSVACVNMGYGITLHVRLSEMAV